LRPEQEGRPVKQQAKLRPWQFSLRFLLAVTALVAVGAAFFGWRERRLEPQRRAVARIVELGGSVEMERRGWIEAIWHCRDTEEVVNVTLPGHLMDKALPKLQVLPSLRHVTMAYSIADVVVDHRKLRAPEYYFLIDGNCVDPVIERPRLDRLQMAIPDVEIAVSHDGVVVPVDVAFVGRSFHVR
jgi:hypothetical protein